MINLNTKYAAENAFKRVKNWVKGPRVRIQPRHFCSFFSASVIKKYHDEKTAWGEEGLFGRQFQAMVPSFQGSQAGD